MRLKIVIAVLLLLVVGIGGQAVLGSGRSVPDPLTRDCKSPRAEVVRAQVEEVRAESVAGITVDVVDEAFLGLTVTDRAGDVMVLDFVRNETSDAWVPVLPAGNEGLLFGADPHIWLLPSLVMGENAEPPKIELLPLDDSIGYVPHDDVTVFVVDETLVLVILWEDGRIIGVYYGVDTDAGVAGEDGGSVGGRAAQPKAKQAVCAILLDACLGKKTEHWVLACGLWLHFCGDGDNN